MGVDASSSSSLKLEKFFDGKFWATIYAAICQIMASLYSSILSDWCRPVNWFENFWKLTIFQLPSMTFRKMVKNFFGIELVDFFNIPLHRRLESFAVFQWTATFLYCGLTSLGFLLMLLVTPFFYIPVLCFSWYFYDYRTPEQGGRRFEFIRNWRIWKHCRDYFPILLHRTAKIDPSRNYLFLYHPHGIMAFGAFICFGTNASRFSELFPGLRSTLLTLKYQFLFPIQRDYCMAFGACACSRESIEWLLTRNGTGNAIVLVVGGATEALEARPGSFTLTIKQRKGFVRLALQNGTPLVPMFAFGENSIFNQASNPPGSRLRKFQNVMMKLCSFSPPFFYGRGMFNYTFGFMPYRQPINVVVGSPMEVEKVENPTEDQIDQVHQQYLDHLTELFESHKSTYGVPSEQHLCFV